MIFVMLLYAFLIMLSLIVCIFNEFYVGLIFLAVSSLMCSLSLWFISRNYTITFEIKHLDDEEENKNSKE